jgi:hypothetical protein
VDIILPEIFKLQLLFYFLVVWFSFFKKSIWVLGLSAIDTICLSLAFTFECQLDWEKCSDTLRKEKEKYYFS